MDNLFETAVQDARIAASAVQEGVKIGQRDAIPLRDSLRAIIAAYDLALQNAGTKIPTPLHMAIEAARLKL